MKAIGVDIGGNHRKSVLVGFIEHSSVVSYKVYNKASSRKIFKQWSNFIHQTLEKTEPNSVVEIGFVMPIPFNYQTEIALFKGNDKYERLYGLNISKGLHPFLHISEKHLLRFHNDASCFVIGEDGYAKPYKKSISIILGSGFGYAFMNGDVPIIILQDVLEDGCLWHLSFKDGIADKFFSKRWFVPTYYKPNS